MEEGEGIVLLGEEQEFKGFLTPIFMSPTGSVVGEENEEEEI